MNLIESIINYKKVFWRIVLFLFMVSMLIFFYFLINLTQAKSSDAIAIRVVPNPNHLSAYDWYFEKNFSGSPKLIIVDGYEAIRVDRTVYVNAANIAGDNLYTNIYVISYNQESEKATIDIFNEMVNNWKFNSNLNATGRCRGNTDKICLGDADCASGDFCDSIKARVTRDTRRLADEAKVSLIMEKYKKNNGHYPMLAEGTYLPRKSTSVWPSWRDYFSEVIEKIMPLDPVNKIGECSDPRFNEITCWDDEAKEFDDQASGDNLDLPTNSLVYTYRAYDDGNHYDFCKVMESGYNY